MEHNMVNPEPYAGPPGDDPTRPAPPPPPPAYGPPPSGPGYPPPPFTPPGGAPGMPMNAVGQPGNLTDRFVARLVDGVIVGVVGVLLNIVLAAISNSWLLTGFISAVATAALYLGYFAYFES